MRLWFSAIQNVAVRAKRCLLSWVSMEVGGSGSELLFTGIKRTVLALITFVIALGGATVGIITGAIKGQTTETGLLRGAGVGAVAGAITAVQLLELMVNGEPFSKVALLYSLINGKIFMEWVSPAVLKAYQWQTSNMETSLRDISDIFEVNTSQGLSQDIIMMLPVHEFHAAEPETETTAAAGSSPGHETSCAICLQEFKNRDPARMLPSCKHVFHLDCIDEWLLRNGTCPVCRTDV